MEKFQLGPWKGMNNAQQADARVFQLPQREERRLPAVAVATDVDFDNDGWVQRRADIEQRIALTEGLAGFSGVGLLLVQDSGTIKRVDPTDWSTVDLVTGLSPLLRVVFHTHAGQVFWTNGEVTGRILADGTPLNWGCTVPIPVLAVVAGNLRAGRYLVSAIFVDAAGVEHGAAKAAEIDLLDGQGIQVSIPWAELDPNAVVVRYFASKPNNPDLFFVGSAVASTAPLVIDDVEVSEEPLRTQFLSPPLPADGLFSYRGSLVLFAEDALFPSYGVNAHLYEVADIIESRPSVVLAGAGLDDGFWTICEDGAYWTTGDVPENWQTWRKDSRSYAAGALVLEGSLIPSLQVSANVALFVSSTGIVAGLPGGTLVPLPDEDALRLDVQDKRASMAYSVQNELRQVLFCLE